MTTRPPAEIGMPLDEVDTPALVVDLDAFERNLRRLADRIAGSPVKARPHAKTHKCPIIALKQVELGAVGVCVQKVSEAEAMVYGGVRDVLVTNEIVGRQKLRRLTALAHNARIGVCADDIAQVQRARGGGGRGRRHLAGLCRGQHGRQPLWCRAGRARPRPRPPCRRRPAPRLCRIAGLSRLGPASARLGRAPPGDRQAADKAGRTRDLLARHGIDCPTITGAGTGTFEFEIGERRLHRAAMRLLHLHGRRLRPQPRP